MRRIQDYLPDTGDSSGRPIPPAHLRFDGDCDPDCPECGGAGYVRYDYPIDHPLFGKLSRCSRALKRDLERMRSDPRTGLRPEELRELSWNSITSHSPIYQHLDEIKHMLNVHCGFVLLVGNPGIGKTTLLRVAVAEALNAGTPAAYANLSSALDHLRSAYDAQNAGDEMRRRLEWWMGLAVLSLDEIDKINDTPWARERIHMLLNSRYEAALEGNGLTLVAANREPDDPYLISRFSDGRVGRIFRLNGTDIRIMLGRLMRKIM